MRYSATSELLAVIAFSVTCQFYEARGDTVCQCATPPGGSVTCPDGFFAMCLVRDGKANGSCTPIPQSALQSEKALQIWVLGKVLGRDIRPEDIGGRELQLILKNQRYENSARQEVVMFKFPKR